MCSASSRPIRIPAEAPITPPTLVPGSKAVVQPDAEPSPEDDGGGELGGLAVEFDQVRRRHDDPDIRREGEAGAGYRRAALCHHRSGRERDCQGNPGTANRKAHDELLGEGWGPD